MCFSGSCPLALWLSGAPSKGEERSGSPEIASAKEHVRTAEERGVPPCKDAFALELDDRCPVAHRSLWILESGHSLGSPQELPVLQRLPSFSGLRRRGQHSCAGFGGAVRGLHAELCQGPALHAPSARPEPAPGAAAGPRRMLQADQDESHRETPAWR